MFCWPVADEIRSIINIFYPAIDYSSDFSRIFSELICGFIERGWMLGIEYSILPLMRKVRGQSRRVGRVLEGFKMKYKILKHWRRPEAKIAPTRRTSSRMRRPQSI
ncbi:indole-3-acetic acid-amido synthetase gh3.2 [Phtheirospermum japonicum]|uniref:Indole-3-acetic acid-amido synthetase gh3.2 n=1 Tax=Phtheirospermum japonicum TaxID=374723 RepID=A0A830CZU1_9LAMI|nr:indole-3-acetic acid-amido synthetase gh3.2 [Phtheirospermum japonicum]